MIARQETEALTALVVDDKKQIHRLMESVLYAFGFRKVMTASDGFEAERVLHDHGKAIDIVFCDLQMPHMGGIDFIRTLRSGPHKSLPVVVVTGHGDREILSEAVNVGIEGFLAKPISPDQVAAHLGPALQKQRIDRTVFELNERLGDYLEEGTGETGQPPIVWSKDIEVGHEIIDSEHKNLVGIINGLLETYKKGAEANAVEGKYRQLMDYTEYHFGHEEDLMRKSDYPDFKAHKRQHEDFVEKVRSLFDRHSAGDETSTPELMKLLASWWVAHINYTDKRLAAFLKTKLI